MSREPNTYDTLVSLVGPTGVMYLVSVKATANDEEAVKSAERFYNASGLRVTSREQC